MYISMYMGYVHSVLEQIQEIWHDTLLRLVWLQSRGKTITEIFKNGILLRKSIFFKNPQDLICINCFRDNIFLGNQQFLPIFAF